MRTIMLLTVLLAGMLAGGCSWFHYTKKPAPAPAVQQSIVTPDTSLIAKVMSVNSVGRFVVLGFPPGQVPKVDQIFFLYRAGLKVGEVRITGPQNDNNIVADLSTGDAQVGDVVRDQ
jgi:hypothetical protein